MRWCENKELLELLTPEFRIVLGGQAQVSEKLQEFRRKDLLVKTIAAELQLMANTFDPVVPFCNS
jgi:hypothetical protein